VTSDLYEVVKMASVDAEPEVPVCRDFLRHACTRGTRCRFRHDSASGRGDQSTSGGHYDGCHPCFKTSVDGVDRQAATDDSGDVADYKDGDDVIVEINSPHTGTQKYSYAHICTINLSPRFVAVGGRLKAAAV